MFDGATNYLRLGPGAMEPPRARLDCARAGDPYMEGRTGIVCS
jgi:hypothetical protein